MDTDVNNLQKEWRKRNKLYEYAPADRFKDGEKVEQKARPEKKISGLFVNVQNCKNYVNNTGRQISRPAILILNDKVRKLLDVWIEMTPNKKRVNPAK